MKTVLVLIILLTSFTAYSQKLNESDIPEAVKKTFSENYPDVKNAKWEFEHGNYEAEFKVNNVEKTAVINKMGHLSAVETEINISSLPEAVQSAVSKDYPSASIKEASKIETEGGIEYEVEIRDGNNSPDLIYSADGKFLHKKTDDNIDDDK